MTIGTLRDQITYPLSIKSDKEDANLLEFLKLVIKVYFSWIITDGCVGAP